MIASFAQVCQIYGMPAALGRLYAHLFLSPQPLSLQDLADATGQAKSTTSVALRRLERARVVRRLPRGSDRKDYYVGVTDPLELTQDWVRHFVQPELQVAGTLVGSMGDDLEAAAAAGEYDEAEREEMRLRVEQMRRALRVGEAVVAAISDGSLDDLATSFGTQGDDASPTDPKEGEER